LEIILKYITTDHNNGLDIVKSNVELGALWSEIESALSAITDERLKKQIPLSNNKMSLSSAINDLIDEELTKRGWVSQSAIFQGEKYKDKRWRLDFSKRVENPKKDITGMAVEVAFNHGEAIAWNLMKPVLAAEINHVGTQTNSGAGVGIYICATKSLKKAGGFDGAVGEYKKVLRYLLPMAQKLTRPLIIVGLEAPETFKIVKRKDPVTKKNAGELQPI
jgi:hypothetical protein